MNPDKCEVKDCSKPPEFECQSCDSLICEDCAYDEDYDCPVCGEPLIQDPKKQKKGKK